MKGKIKGIGLRNIKTATAVILCIILTRLFALIGEGINFGIFEKAFDFLFVRPSPLYSAVAAMVAMGTTMDESRKSGFSRIWGAFIGGAFATVHLWLNSTVNDELFYYLSVFVFIVLLIHITSLFFASNITAVSGMIFLIIIFSAKDEPPFIYALHRLIDTAGGVAVALTVNRVINKKERPG